MRTKNDNLSRRNFLKQVAIGAIGAGIGVRGLGNVKIVSGGNEQLPGFDKSNVIAVRNIGIMKSGAPDFKNIKKMMDEGMFALTGKKTTTDAWREFFNPKDVVGIKVNPIGGKRLSTRPEVVNAIVLGLTAAGVKENNIIVWDRFDEHLVHAGYRLNKGSSGIRCYGTEHTSGYDKSTYYESEDDDHTLRQDGDNRSFYSSVATKQVNAIINVPVMKDHGIAGVSLCLKNLAFGVINNTARFHPSPYFCDPAVAEVCAHPAIRDRVRLHILDALQACFSGGPTNMKSHTMWNEERLFIGTDPVAIDRVGLEIIDKRRKENNFMPVFQTAKLIATAWKNGLGVFDKNNIELIELDV
ncbi:MAG: hypothetical protein A2Z57_11660 [Planctomycetes bacterium RIFCSPHIGHO2_12_39_6]|nr:MAG: hypothetical protein A2Z57_11660 [Planctomycetes bacterium RIFCSPHIGHO2_12_39_6]